ncbi:MAG: Gfo/Idh/MocA family oxidoreductase [Proteobacteria bacterium]|nr:Gfo/Idh/MocA family oxidoreductase [Pseudomonadota bacterium]
MKVNELIKRDTSARFGLIGTGFMGKAHAIALRTVGTVFADVPAPVLSLLVDANARKAAEDAAAWGFARSGDDWKTVCNDPDIDVVNICTPNHLHKEMALAAAAAGKHIWCEKPLGLTATEAREIWQAAEQAGVRTSMGFNYSCNPLLMLTRQMIAAGELGDVYNFRGCYQEDYLSDPKAPFSWRCLRAQGGSGALNDLGTHLINMAEFLLGPIDTLFGKLKTVYTHRPDPASGKLRAVENEDIAQVLLTFANSCVGTMEISRIATGRKCGLTFEIHGTKGSVVFDQERMNELRIYRTDEAAGRRGHCTILAGPEHPDYANFCPAPGHGLGINDLKIIEARNLLRSIKEDTPIFSDFRNGWRVQSIVEAVEQSHQQQEWIDVREGSTPT